MTERDWEILHYATGLLVGLGHKYGLINLNIYHDSMHVVIEPVVSKPQGEEDGETANPSRLGR